MLDRHDLETNHPYISLIDRIKQRCVQLKRPQGSVSLTAVSKNQPFEKIDPVLRLGHRCFGENRVQDAKVRWGPLKDHYPDLHLRLIGPLQSNKALEAVAFFDAIETIDRDKIAQSIADAQQKLGKACELFIQVNIGDEPQKAGISLLEVDEFVKKAQNHYGLKISGLMCMPPVVGPRGPYFALLAKLGQRHGFSRLSMGMSDDFETAIDFGATEVRIGSALFGSRDPAQGAIET